MEREVIIAGFGMVSALGHDAISACAAARAGISRARELGVLKVQREDDGELEGVVGHSVQGLTDGFEGDGRFLVLGLGALKDLFQSIVKEGINWKKTYCFLTLPQFDRTRLGAELIQDESLRKIKEQQSFTDSADSKKHMKKARGLMKRLLQLGEVGISENNCYPIFGDHEAFLVAINKAKEALHNKEIDYAIVGSIDSLIDHQVLSWLYQTKRLKCSDNPAGIQPGEASTFFLLQRKELKPSSSGSLFVKISNIEPVIESNSLLTGQPSSGVGLTKALTPLCEVHDATQPLWVVNDQNGELYRAYEWGIVLPRLSANFPWIKDAPISFPIMNFGETGSACSGVAMSYVCRAWQRGYGLAPSAYIFASSSQGKCGAMSLSLQSFSR